MSHFSWNKHDQATFLFLNKTLKGSHIAAWGTAPGLQIRVYKAPRQYTPSKLHTLSRGVACEPVRGSRALTRPIDQPSERDYMPYLADGPMVIQSFIDIPGAVPQAVFYDPFRVWFTGSKADFRTVYLI